MDIDTRWANKWQTVTLEMIQEFWKQSDANPEWELRLYNPIHSEVELSFKDEYLEVVEKALYAIGLLKD